LLSAAALSTALAKKPDPYYTIAPTLLPAPSSTGKTWPIKDFGPVGIGIDLKRPGMTMVIRSVAEGSPADKTGKLEKGQIIESINGVVLQDRDPREILGDIITEAEAKDGRIVLRIQDQGDVLVQIPVMGRYSETWPENCAKSDKIVRNLADYLAGQEKPGWGAVLFMLSTGEEKDLDVVRRWMNGIETIGGMNWEKGYKGIGLCEYYLRTGDESVLPVIKKMVDETLGNMYRGSWSGRGSPARFQYGPLHAAGVHCTTFLVMARLCGVHVDQRLFDTALTQFYRYAGHGNVAYGDGPPEGGFRDNGKTSGLAVTMAAAALLAPEGESSVYAKARDHSAMKAFYAHNWFHAAHTGGGMGEIWHHKAMHLVREKRPIAYRSYMDARRWVMELSRRHDGTIGIAGMMDRYDKSASEHERAWGNYFALTYTLPRKQLQLFGAPRSKWAQHDPLPERPWGTPADDIFQSMDPVPNPVLKKAHLYRERVETDASLPLLNGKLKGPGAPMYLHHPEIGLRIAAMRNLMRAKKYDLILPLLKSDDPRLRHCGILGIVGPFKGPSLPDDELSPEMIAELVEMVQDPDESWWVLQAALGALSRADEEVIMENKDRLIELSKSESQWVRHGAVSALTEIALEPKYTREVLPYVVRGAANPYEGWHFPFQIFRDLSKRMDRAPDSVKEYAEPILRQAYNGIPDHYEFPGGAIIQNGSQAHRTRIAQVLNKIPGNMEFIVQRPKKTLAYMLSGNDRDLYTYDGNFEPNETIEGKWAWVWMGRGNSVSSDPLELKANSKGWVENWKKQGSESYAAGYGFHFKPGGEVNRVGRGYPQCIWSGDKLIGIYANEVYDLQTFQQGGLEFMIVPTRFTSDDPNDSGEEAPEWEPVYQLYVKESGPMKFDPKRPNFR